MTKAGESSIVTKCAKVMDILSHAPRPLAFSEIIEKTGFVKSSTHRILSVLQSEELVEYDKASRSYSTGPRLRDWARSAWRRKDLQQIASNFMYALSEETGMNSALSILDGDAILYIRTVDMIQLRYASHTGDRAPLHNTAAGKVFLAHMSERRQQDLLNNLTFERFTENTIQTPRALKIQLNEVREEGFAKALGEEVLHVTGIAAPIWDSEDKVVACLSLWSQTEHATRDEVVSKADQLKDAAQLISEQLS